MTNTAHNWNGGKKEIHQLEPQLPRSTQTVCLSKAMFTSLVVWPRYGSPSVLVGLSMCPLAAGPLFSTCVILCTREMNSIIEVLCFLLSLLLLSPCSVHIYYTRDQDLPQAFGSSRGGDFIPSKIPQHGTSTSHVTLVIKGCWVPGGLCVFTDACWC